MENVADIYPQQSERILDPANMDRARAPRITVPVNVRATRTLR